MDIPRGHAMLPLNTTDFLTFIYTYFKAEYSPIRSLWSTATAIPTSPHRWQTMGHELSPLSIRPANAQAQKDLDSLDYFLRKWNLDATFVRGLVVRYAKYDAQHERLEKKLFECCRVDLMVRKALKEKHLIDGLWPSPAPRDIPQELLQQGVQVRKWYGDMFGKYFTHLHSIEDFSLRPEVDARIKSSTTLMLVPFVEHLVLGHVDPIVPIVARGAGYANTVAGTQVRKREEAGSFGEPARFEVRFEAPGGVSGVEETVVRSVVRQCQCLKCGSKRDVNVTISMDPSPGPVTGGASGKQKSREGPGRGPSRTAMKYRPGYSIPGNDTAPKQPQQPTLREEQQEDVRSPSPQQKKQCPACTFLNHPDLTACEMCQSDLPDTVITKSATPPPHPHPPQQSSSSSKNPPRHAHSASVPANTAPASPSQQGARQREGFRPALPNRQSLSSTLFSIFPFSQTLQSDHHANLPPTQPSGTQELQANAKAKAEAEAEKITPSSAHDNGDQGPENEDPQRPSLPARTPSVPTPSTPPNLIDNIPDGNADDNTPHLSNHPEMAMMPLTPPPPVTSTPRRMPAGLPQNLMDDYVPVDRSPFLREQDDEDAGWGEIRREDVRREGGGRGMDSDSDDEGEEGGRGSTEGMIDLDAVAREEMGVWGERED
ncbi:hypothetical protein CC80DRAFT_498099 [Byssothecium circinans]|uniref:RanBP2-type domain-containing protein n=1 Tax=Byssothecium circinans TaxID=147558 RepID=A0A6A5TCG4_9PLEO|nr:hypothetical protein CC80DRAFT_498190 [Byssothecium circinans]KAF1948608.1 hypothetical protein CC80DRAFT_498099 [Byssothecium circinans]